MGLFKQTIGIEEHLLQISGLQRALNFSKEELEKAQDNIKQLESEILTLTKQEKTLQEQVKTLESEIVTLKESHKKQVEELKQLNLVARGLTKKKLKNSILQVRLNSEEKAKLRKIAEQKDSSLSEIIKECIHSL